MIGVDGHESCSQTNVEGKSFLGACSSDSRLCCCQLRKDQTMSTQNLIRAIDAEAAELDAIRAVYDMLKPLEGEAQTRVSTMSIAFFVRLGRKTMAFLIHDSPRI